jgi:hypothetical protein
VPRMNILSFIESGLAWVRGRLAAIARRDAEAGKREVVAADKNADAVAVELRRLDPTTNVKPIADKEPK